MAHMKRNPENIMMKKGRGGKGTTERNGKFLSKSRKSGKKR